MNETGCKTLLKRAAAWVAMACAGLSVGSCVNLPGVVLYTSVDEPVSSKVVRVFERKSGVRVRLITDTEASKSIGLAERLRSEVSAPRCDVWWGNEPFLTLALAEEGILQKTTPTTGVGEELKTDESVFSDVPDAHKDVQGRWAASGQRLRVLAVHEPVDSGGAGDVTASISEKVTLQDLLDPKFKGKIGLARPLAGTTMGHMAALRVAWGDEVFFTFLRGLRANDAKLLGGNSEVAKQVAQGSLLVGLTDNDDVRAVGLQLGGLRQEIPDQDGMGTLGVPTTVGLVSGRPMSEKAKMLAVFLVSAEAEKEMMDLGFAAASVRESVMADGSTVKLMEVDWAEVAKILPETARLATDVLEGRR